MVLTIICESVNYIRICVSEMEMNSVLRNGMQYDLRERHQHFDEIAVSIFMLLWSFLSQYITSFSRIKKPLHS
jgi:hypothetical protein